MVRRLSEEEQKRKADELWQKREETRMELSDVLNEINEFEEEYGAWLED